MAGKLFTKIAVIAICMMGMFAVSFLSPCEAHADEDSDYTIFAMNDVYKDKVSIPQNLPKSVQLEGFSSGATYSASGKIITVSSSGLVKPYNESKPTFGIGTVTVKDGGQTTAVTVKLENYADVYAEGKMQEYLDENLTPGMTQLEKVKKITRYPALFPYSAKYQSYTDMVIFEGGDCWASANTIKKMCDMVGIDAHVRYAASDSGAGSGHRNCAVNIEDKTYICEAGYGETSVPRSWDVYEIPDGFSYRVKDGKAIIYQYDGCRQNLTIPSEINGYPVNELGLGKNTFNGGDLDIESITVEEGIEKINKSFFNSMETVRRIHLPSTVQLVEPLAFTSCTSLDTLTFADGAQYISRENVVYTKDMKTLLWYPCISNRTEYRIPAGVERIEDYAFYYSFNVGRVIIPSTVTSIGEGAIPLDSNIKEMVFMGNMPEIDPKAFYCFKGTIYYTEGDTTWEGASNKLGSAGKITYATRELENGPIDTGEGLCFYVDGEPFLEEGLILYDNFFYYVRDDGLLATGSFSIRETNGLLEHGTYLFLDDGRMYIDENSVSLNVDGDSFEYSGTEITPAAQVTIDGSNVAADIEYVNNINAGTGSVMASNIPGCGSMTLQKDFTITRKPVDIEASVAESAVYTGSRVRPAVTVSNLPEGEYTVTYGNNVNVGQATVLVKADRNYEGEKILHFQITSKPVTPKITMSSTSLTYNGEIRRPAITVMDGSTLIAEANYDVQKPESIDVGTYSIKVTLKGNYKGSASAAYKIIPKGTSITSAKGAKKAFTVKWNKQKVQMTGYQIVYAKNKSFTSAKAKKVSALKTSVKVKKLSKKKTYYVKIRTYKTIGDETYYSSWSKVKSVKTK